MNWDNQSKNPTVNFIVDSAKDHWYQRIILNTFIWTTLSRNWAKSLNKSRIRCLNTLRFPSSLWMMPPSNLFSRLALSRRIQTINQLVRIPRMRSISLLNSAVFSDHHNRKIAPNEIQTSKQQERFLDDPIPQTFVNPVQTKTNEASTSLAYWFASSRTEENQRHQLITWLARRTNSDVHKRKPDLSRKRDCQKYIGRRSERRLRRSKERRVSIGNDN